MSTRYIDNNNGFKMDTVKEITALKAKIEIVQVTLDNKLNNIVEQITDFSEKQAEMFNYFIKNKECVETFKNFITEHSNYHQKNEPAWGIWTALKRKPLLLIIVGITMASILGIGLDDVLIIIKNQVLKLF